MSYLTVEVEIDHGHVLTKDSQSLPEKGFGLLTILQADGVGQVANTPLQALELLQKHLRLDDAGAMAWQSSVREARR